MNFFVLRLVRFNDFFRCDSASNSIPVKFAYQCQRGVRTLTNADSGQSQNCSGNLEISPGIGTLTNFSGKHVIIPRHCRKKSGHREILFHVFI